MVFLRRPARAAGLVVGLVLFAPAPALVVAAFVDGTPAGGLRLTLFPAALALLDPFLAECTRNSVVGAAVVTAASLALGVGLAWIATGWRFWGRAPLVALVTAPAVLSPLFGALGLRILFGGGKSAGLDWLYWTWAETACGTALMSLSATAALARVEPAWTDAARLAGASRRRTWWRMIWPMVRPEIYRSAAGVFTLTLIEPGAPIALGLRRTLAFQIVDAALGASFQPRAAVLALEAALLAAVTRWILRSLGGSPARLAAVPSVARAVTASWPRAAALATVLGMAATLACLPLATLTASAFSMTGAAGSHRVPLSASTFFERLDDPQSRDLLAGSLVVGVGATALGLVLAGSLSGLSGRRRVVVKTVLTAWPDALPPLSIGVGALAVPWLAALAAGTIRTGGGPARLAGGLAAVADGLDPVRTPVLLLVLAVAAASQPALARVAGRVRSPSEPALVDAAISLGASPRRARRAAAPGRFGLPGPAVVFALVLAASNLAPALILTPTVAAGPAAPGILALADQPDGAASRAAALSVCLIVASLAALALAARDRSGWLGEWFRRN